MKNQSDVDLRSLIAFMREEHGVGRMPLMWTICDACDGSGGRALGGIAIFDMDEWELEDRADYFAGKMDSPCGQCGSTGKVQEVDLDRLSSVDKEAVNRYRQDLYEYRELAAHEMRMGY